ncbi:hypothetical protein BCY86_05930 [Pajaroellobacter abortibovis]|uniref:Peptidyl-prolyl cis-trans isomerase n=2 Tax=Pajaroellobacter abortibovis TaxID=1882918 RepID=A0A1L6MZE1_9BACT|nr:hypothetical protein BCY86_05930 [Pajaroellobacter abortibovis]
MECQLYEDKASNAVANFVGLARGIRLWRDPVSKQWVKKPAYDGTTFHRVIKDFMVQGGDPKGDGTGDPGYVIDDEIWPGAKHDRPGLLCMANRGPNTNGAQFFITHKAATHLDGGYTIFGECVDKESLQALDRIATTPVKGSSPITPVKIEKIVITRGTPRSSS